LFDDGQAQSFTDFVGMPRQCRMAAFEGQLGMATTFFESHTT